MAVASIPLTYVQEAIRRWRAQGLIDDALARALSEEAEAAAEVEQRRQSQHTVAALGAIVLAIALAVFFAWAWPDLSEVARVFVLIGAGAALFGAGTAIMRRQRWMPVGYGLQALGTIVLLAAYGYSEEVWPQATRPAQLVGLLAILTPLVLARVGLDRSPGTAVFATGFGFAFLYVGVVRATTWSPNTIIWIFDVALLALVAWVWLHARASRRPLDARETAVLTVAIFFAMVFVTLTAFGPLEMERWAMLPVDVWVAAVLALCFVGLESDTPPLPREWFARMIAACAILAIPLAFWTLIGGLGLEHHVPVTLVVGALGALWILIALRRGLPELLPVGGLTVIAAAWYFSIEAGGALLTALALAFTAGVLFWVSGRLSRA